MKTCSLCEKPHLARGYCGMHYERWRKKGDAQKESYYVAQSDFEKAFWSRVNKTDTCWLWIGCVKSNGYGEMMRNRRIYYVHRLSYEMSKGEIPKDLCIDHLCGNRACVNPAHLEAVTGAENTRRAGRRKTHCRNGHELAGYNQSFNSEGHRWCKTCNRGYYHTAKAKKAALDALQAARKEVE